MANRIHHKKYDFFIDHANTIKEGEPRQLCYYMTTDRIAKNPILEDFWRDVNCPNCFRLRSDFPDSQQGLRLVVTEK